MTAPVQGAIVFAVVPPATNNGQQFAPAMVVNVGAQIGSTGNYYADLWIFACDATPRHGQQFRNAVAGAVVYPTRAAALAAPNSSPPPAQAASAV